jgi:hypothetical protein
VTDTKIFEFKPSEAIELGASVANGIQKVLDDYTSGKTVEGVTSYLMLGNLYVVVVTA